MNVGVIRESFPGERRVALVPGVIGQLTGAGLKVLVEAGSGVEAGHADAEYEAKGATVLADRKGLLDDCDVVCQVRTPGANPAAGDADRELFHAEQAVIGLADPLGEAGANQAMAGKGVTVFALELLPRITRAQSMDVLSSQATVQGYKAVIIAAERLPKMIPMMMTAAGTLRSASALVIGAGVAGLQAIATARRLGAVVRAYDIRPAVREQVVSLGAVFLETALDTRGAEDRGGYAKAMDDTFYRRQQEVLAAAVAESDLVVTTAAVPGKRSPVLVTAAMVDRMKSGAVIVDLAAERGGNCELTRADEVVEHRGVTILGPTNLPSTVPHHASQMYARNIVAFLLHLLQDGRLSLDRPDEIIEQTMLTRGGEIVQPRMRELLGLAVSSAP